MKRKLSVEVVLMCVMRWSKEMPASDGRGNNIPVDRIESEKRNLLLRLRLEWVLQKINILEIRTLQWWINLIVFSCIENNFVFEDVTEKG